MGGYRLRELDALRAFALFGILAVNIWFFADPWTLAGGVSPDHNEPVDTATRFVVSMFFEAKFYVLFSFLFGYSFVLQWDSAHRAGVSPVPRTFRRLCALAGIGLLHGLVLFYGDILLTYAAFGFVLLAARSITPRAAIITAAAIIGAFSVLLLLAGVLVLLVGMPADGAGIVEPNIAALTAGPGTALAANIGSYLITLPAVLLFQGPLALAMFYLGLAAAKKRLLEEPISSRTLRLTALICLPVGLLAAGFQAFLINYADRLTFSALASGISTLTAPLLTAGYVSLLLLLFRTAAGRKVLAGLAPAGRMALTNYLGQSLILAVIFTAYGFSLTNQLPPAAVLGVVVAIFVFQLTLSALWLRRFSMGPVEFALRRITYRGEPAAKPAS